jgi:short-chain 2-methylacyl-CoA dehydrogenase
MNFELTDEQRLLRDTVRDFARQEVAPVAEELDRTKAFPYELVAKMGELVWESRSPRSTAGAARTRSPTRSRSRS